MVDSKVAMLQAIEGDPVGKPKLEYNPYLPSYIASPYEKFDELRQYSPIFPYRLTDHREWILTRFDDIKSVLMDKRFIVENLPARVPGESSYIQATRAELERLKNSLRPWLFSLDPPEHTRFRQLVSRDFTSSMLASLQPYINQQVTLLFRDLSEHGEIDLMSKLAKPLPLIVSAKLLGIDIQNLSELIRHSENLFKIFEQPLLYPDYQRMVGSADFFNALLEKEIQDRKNGLEKDDLLGRLIMKSKTSLSQTDLVSFVGMLFAVGQETTENYIGNSVAALLENEDQYEQLKRDPKLMDIAISELGRYDSPVQIISRVASEDVRLGDTVINQHDRVYLALGAANRDPAQYTRPEQLSFERSQIFNFPFGNGIHFCLGHVLAKMQLKAVLQHVVAERSLQVDWTKSVRRKTVVIRGYRSLFLSYSNGA